MGCSKPLLPFGDEPLICHLVRRLGGAFAEVIVAAGPAQELPPLGATVVRDRVVGRGPVAGLIAGLSASTREGCFVASCDLPFLDVAVGLFLAARLPGHDVVVPSWGDRLQPLCAVYSTAMVEPLTAMLARDQLRPIELFQQVRTLVVSPGEIAHLDPEGLTFRDVTGPDDYVTALELWDAIGARRSGVRAPG